MLYVADKEEPMRFLGNRRAIGSVLSKNAAVAKRLAKAQGDVHRTVHDHWLPILMTLRSSTSGSLSPVSSLSLLESSD